MAYQFTDPWQIAEYGDIIQGLNSLMKDTGKMMRHFEAPEQEWDAIVGDGAYNSKSAKDAQFVLQGRAEYASRRDPKTIPNYTGMFGAFGPVHLPQMALAAQLPSLLGKEHGCKLAITHEGETYTLPLDQVKLKVRPERSAYRVALEAIARFEPLAQSKNYKSQVAALTLVEDTALTNANGKKYVLPKDYAVIGPADRNEGYDPYGIREYSPDARRNEMRCSIIDREGETIAPRAAANILWGAQGAKAMKQRDPNDPIRITLGSKGTDDDFTAEGALIAALRELKKSHDIDIMPRFQALVESSKAALLKRPDYISAIKTGVSIAQGYKKLCAANPAIARHYEHETRHFDEGLALIPKMQNLMNIDSKIFAEAPLYETTVIDKLAKEVPSIEEKLRTQDADMASIAQQQMEEPALAADHAQQTRWTHIVKQPGAQAKERQPTQSASL